MLSQVLAYSGVPKTDGDEHRDEGDDRVNPGTVDARPRSWSARLLDPEPVQARCRRAGSRRRRAEQAQPEVHEREGDPEGERPPRRASDEPGQWPGCAPAAVSSRSRRNHEAGTRSGSASRADDGRHGHGSSRTVNGPPPPASTAARSGMTQAVAASRARQRGIRRDLRGVGGDEGAEDAGEARRRFPRWPASSACGDRQPHPAADDVGLVSLEQHGRPEAFAGARRRSGRIGGDGLPGRARASRPSSPWCGVRIARPDVAWSAQIEAAASRISGTSASAPRRAAGVSPPGDQRRRSPSRAARPAPARAR